MYEIYTIQNGDTIESIAAKYNIDPSVIYQINGLNSNPVLNVGTNLVLPAKKNNNFSYYVIKQGDNLYNIAKQNNTSVDIIAKLNGLNTEDYIYPNQTIIIPKQGVNLYFVKENETLADISNNLKTDVLDILRKNSKIYLVPEQIIIY